MGALGGEDHGRDFLVTISNTPRGHTPNFDGHKYTRKDFKSIF
jgi:hypothetical protein